MGDEHIDTVTRAPGRARGDERLYVLVLEEESSAIFHLPEDGRVVVGREPGVELHIRDRAASRRHAQLVVRRGEVEVMDLDSHNGTLVNGERITAPRALVSGDVVTIGEVGLVFHSAAESGRAQRVVEVPALRRRLAEEIERASCFARPLSLLALRFREPPADAGAVVRLVIEQTRAVDFMAWIEATQLVVVLPELARAAVPDGLPPHHHGVAAYPDDGLDADALIGAACAAADGGAHAAGESNHVTLGDRTILLADPATLRLFELVRRLARSELPVLISGETGVGKESAAFAVHHWSRRSGARFLPINCAALPDNLVESELFGYEKGAFSGAAAAKPGLLELASGGTVFFDEVGELPAAAQAKLLRVLEEKRAMRLGGVRELDVDVRVVAATNRDLEAEIAAGRFRRDLYFRLSGATVVLPPLRDRPRELALLMRTFLAEACARLGRPVPSVSGPALTTLGRYLWPGNIRELKNAIEYIAAAADGVVGLEHLPEKIGSARAATAPASAKTAEPQPAAHGPRFLPLAGEIEALERARLREALEAAGGVKAKAARLIDMPLRTFVAKLKDYAIAVDRDDD